jgi:hypothetical protein
MADTLTLEQQHTKTQATHQKAKAEVTSLKQDVRLIQENLEILRGGDLKTELEAGINSAAANDNSFGTAAKRLIQYRGEIRLQKQAIAYYEAFYLPDAEMAERRAVIAVLEAELELVRARLGNHEAELSKHVAALAELNDSPINLDTAGAGLAQQYREQIGSIHGELKAVREQLQALEQRAIELPRSYEEAYHE